MNRRFYPSEKISQKKYYLKNREKLIQVAVNYRKNHPLILTQEQRIIKNKHSKQYYQIHKEKMKKQIVQAIKKRYKERRILVINHYTNGKNSCQCPACDETNFKLLTLDHINNDGKDHRNKINESIYDWLFKNNFPPGFQILCWNCNMGRAHNNGICPHISSKSYIFPN